MSINKNSQFEAKGKIWSYLPNNGYGMALFDGEPIPSKSVVEIIGEEGVKKIDEILKSMKRAKEIIYGEDSPKVCSPDTQYFSVIEKIPSNSKMDIKKIIRERPLIICNGGDIGSCFLDGTINDFKLDRWDIDKVKKNIARCRDYVIHIIEDTNEIIRENASGDGKSHFKHHWERILDDDKRIIERFLGGEKGDFISDQIKGDCIDKLK